MLMAITMRMLLKWLKDISNSSIRNRRAKGSIPSASNPASIQTKDNQVIGLIEVWMPPFRSEIENKAVKKTLTIPHWLDKMGKANNVNYSQVLQDALKSI